MHHFRRTWFKLLYAYYRFLPAAAGPTRKPTPCELTSTPKYLLSSSSPTVSKHITALCPIKNPVKTGHNQRHGNNKFSIISVHVGHTKAGVYMGQLSTGSSHVLGLLPNETLPDEHTKIVKKGQNIIVETMTYSYALLHLTGTYKVTRY